MHYCLQLGMAAVIHFYRQPCLSPQRTKQLLEESQQKISANFSDVSTEFCYNVELSAPLTAEDKVKLVFLLSETFEQDQFSESSFLEEDANAQRPPESWEAGRVGKARGSK